MKPNYSTVASGQKGDPIKLLGTYKSMLTPSNLGDVEITLNGVYGLGDLLLGDKETHKTIKADVLLSQKNGESRTIAMEGRCCVANRSDQNMKVYEMIFTQADHLPGGSFFAATFNKTLVQASGSGEFEAQQHQSSLEKGLMLSGHYSQLRAYDLGTLRVHLPSALIIADNGQQLGKQNVVPQVQDSEDVHPSHLLHPNVQVQGARNRVKATSFSHQGYQPSWASQQPQYPYTPPQQYQEPAAYEPQRPHRQTISSPYIPDYQRQQSYSPVVHSTRHCYGCGESGHLHKDCPRDQLFCYNCNQPGHSSKNCRRPKPWEQQQQQQASQQEQQFYDPSRSPTYQGQYQQQQQQQPSSFEDQSSWNMNSLSESLTPQMYYKQQSPNTSAAWSPVLNNSTNAQSSPMQSHRSSFSSGSPSQRNGVLKAAPGLTSFASNTSGLFASNSGSTQNDAGYGKAVGSGSYSSTGSSKLNAVSNSLPKISELKNEDDLRIEDLIADDNDEEVWSRR